MIKILGIAASPRRKGNSEALLDSLLDGASSRGAIVKKIILNELQFKACQSCRECNTTIECVQDDCMSELFKLFDEADVVVISTPIYFGSISAQLKTMIDRFQPLWVKKEVYKKSPLSPKKRKGIFLCVSAANKRNFFEHARTEIRILFSMLGIKYSGEIYCGGVEDKGDIKGKKAVLKKARLLGSRLAAGR